MGAYGYEARPTDYSFVAAAGQQIASGVLNASKAKTDAKNYKLDEAKFSDAHQKILDELSKKYMEDTGETDPVKAMAFTSRFFPGKFKSEEVSDALKRIYENIPKFDAALEEAKVNKFHADTAANKPQPYQRPEGQVEVPQARPTAAPGTPEFAQKPTSFDGVAGMQARALAEPPPSDIMTGPAESAQEMQARADRLNVGSDKSVVNKIQSTQNIETGQEYTGGQNKAQYIAGMAARGIDVTGGAAKEIAGATPTEMQIQTDKTRRDIAAENQRLRAEYNRINKMRVNLYGQKLTADQRMDIIAEKRKNQDAKDDVEKQIADIQQKMADKDYFGNIDENSRNNLNEQVKQLKLSSAIYDEIDAEFSGLLKEKGGVKPVPPAPAPAQQQSKFKIISVK